MRVSTYDAAAPKRSKRVQAMITRAYVRHYSDNGQTKAYVEWSDGSRTEGHAHILGDKPGA